jgi:hypothetical protein
VDDDGGERDHARAEDDETGAAVQGASVESEHVAAPWVGKVEVSLFEDGGGVEVGARRGGR